MTNLQKKKFNCIPSCAVAFSIFRFIPPGTFIVKIYTVPLLVPAHNDGIICWAIKKEKKKKQLTYLTFKRILYHNI